MIKIIIILASLIFTTLAFAQDYDNSQLKAILNTVSDPKLSYPVDEIVNLEGKDNLVFHWSLSANNPVGISLIEFRLFSGEKNKVQNIIFIKRLTPQTYSISLSSNIFDDGQYYRWEIIQYFLRGQDRTFAYATFKVNK